MWIEYTKGADGICIEALYDKIPVAVIPGRIADGEVTTLSDYCFSTKKDARSGGTSSHDDNYYLAYIYTHAGEDDMRGDGGEVSDQMEADDGTYTPERLYKELGQGIVCRLADDYIEEISLPDTINKIGNFCFYQCKNLISISLGKGMIDFGSDVFMNCHLLHTFYIRASASEKTSLRQIMTYRSQETAVFFDDAAIQFPEVMENYDLIGPAHIFELSIEGQGIRVRQCFEDDIFRFDMYDKIFAQAVNTEDEITLCRMAAYRLQYPKSIQCEYKSAYIDYLLKHIQILCDDAIKRHDMNLIMRLGEQGFFDRRQIELCLGEFAKSGWVQGTRELIEKQAAWV